MEAAPRFFFCLPARAKSMPHQQRASQLPRPRMHARPRTHLLLLVTCTLVFFDRASAVRERARACTLYDEVHIYTWYCAGMCTCVRAQD